MPDVVIRLATESDLVAINDIYNWYIPRSTCTYQEVSETIEDRRKWFAHHSERYPVTIAQLGETVSGGDSHGSAGGGGEVVGWGSLSDYRERSAYRFTCENSVYVRHDLRGQGIGKALLADLIQRARTIGFHTIIAGADAEQTTSIALHRQFGFVECGRQKQVGYKFERWLDVVFMQLMLEGTG